MDAVRIVTCACGLELRGTEAELVPLVQQHGRRLHNMDVTPEQVLNFRLEQPVTVVATSRNSSPGQVSNSVENPDTSDPNRNAIPGMASPEERIAHVIELKPDICSLDIGSMNFSGLEA